MPTINSQLPQAEDYLPDWSAKRFIMLDPTRHWASPVTTQTAQLLSAEKSFSGRSVEFETCETARDILLFSDQGSTLGIILFIDGIERDCLSLLGRLARLPLRPPILAVCAQRHKELLPTLLEAGVDTALFDVVNDIPIAAWCARVATN